MNLNLSDAVCDDIYSHKDEQVATQQIVSGLQVLPRPALYYNHICM